MGMTAFTGDAPEVSIFPPAASPKYEVFDRVARLYAADIGLSAEELGRDSWRAKVSVSLAKHYGNVSSHKTVEELFGVSEVGDTDLAAAYLAGAYSQHGTPSGLRLVNKRKGLYLIWLIRVLFVDLTVEATLRPGIPGNITITVRDGGQQTVQGFVEELEMIRTVLSARR